MGLAPAARLGLTASGMRNFLRNLFRKRSEENDHFYAIVEKYGYGAVAAREAYAMFEGMASPGLGGFSIIKPGRFARQVNVDLIHILGLGARKGWSYTVSWGASLPYLPEVRGGRLRWHRTLKSAIFDLWEDPFEYLASPDQGGYISGNYIAQNGFGPQYLRETMTQMWSAVHKPLNRGLLPPKTSPLFLVRLRINRGGTGSGPAISLNLNSSAPSLFSASGAARKPGWPSMSTLRLEKYPQLLPTSSGLPLTDDLQLGATVWRAAQLGRSAWSRFLLRWFYGCC